MKRNQWYALAVAALLFLCGAAVGALANHLFEARSVVAKNADTDRQRYINDMRTKLKLTPDQVNELQAIMDDTKAKVKAVRDSYHPQMLTIKAEHIARVKSILTAQQVPVYEQLVAERERRAAKEQEERDRVDQKAAQHRPTPAQ
jgi:hypothetical protein